MKRFNIIRFILAIVALILIILNIVQQHSNGKLCIAFSLIIIANLIGFVSKDKK